MHFKFLQFLPVEELHKNNYEAFSLAFLNNAKLQQWIEKKPRELFTIIGFINNVDRNSSHKMLEHFLSNIKTPIIYKNKNIVDACIDNHHFLRTLIENNFLINGKGEHYLFSILNNQSVGSNDKALNEHYLKEIFKYLSEEHLIGLNDLKAIDKDGTTVLTTLQRHGSIATTITHHMVLNNIVWLEENQTDQLMYYLGKIDNFPIFKKLTEQYPIVEMLSKYFNEDIKAIINWAEVGLINHKVFNWLETSLQDWSLKQTNQNSNLHKKIKL